MVDPRVCFACGGVFVSESQLNPSTGALLVSNLINYEVKPNYTLGMAK